MSPAFGKGLCVPAIAVNIKPANCQKDSDFFIQMSSKNSLRESIFQHAKTYSNEQA